MSFKAKNALITGSSRGIGRGIALKLAERGARVAVHYYRNREAAQATLESIRKVGSDAFYQAPMEITLAQGQAHALGAGP